MAEVTSASRWRGRIGFTIAAFLLILLQLLPLETLPPSLLSVDIYAVERAGPGEAPSAPTIDPQPNRFFGPDLLLLLTLVFMTRRPGTLPVLVIGALFFLTDLLFHRPPGLWAALVVMLAEFMRYRSHGLRVLPFSFEWATIGAGILAITLVYRITLALMLVPQPPLGLTLLQAGFTIAAYPVVVLLAYVLFAVKRPAQGEVDALGNRL